MRQQKHGGKAKPPPCPRRSSFTFTRRIIFSRNRGARALPKHTYIYIHAYNFCTAINKPRGLYYYNGERSASAAGPLYLYLGEKFLMFPSWPARLSAAVYVHIMRYIYICIIHIIQVTRAAGAVVVAAGKSAKRLPCLYVRVYIIYICIYICIGRERDARKNAANKLN